MSQEEVIVTLLLRGGMLLLAAHLVVSLLLRRLGASATRWVWASVFGLLLLLPTSLRWQPWRIAIPVKAAAVEKVETMEPAEPLALPAPTLELVETQASPVSTPLPDTTPMVGKKTAPSWWVVAWAAGMIVVLAFISCGHLFLWLIARRARPASRGWQRDCADIATRNVRVLVHDRLCVPTTAGVWRPKILIPPSADNFDREARRATLTHELTHIGGRDPLLILAAQCALALQWCNPFAWFAFRSLRCAQERCCDDAVIGSGGAPSDYAGLLLGIARGGSNTFPASAGFALPMAHRSSLDRRIRLILDDSMKRKTLTKIQKFTLGIAVVAIASPLALTGIGTTTANAVPGGEKESSALENKLGAIKIERIDFNGATLEEGTDYLRKVLEEKGYSPINFIILRSAKDGDGRRGTGQNLQELDKRAAEARANLEALEKKLGTVPDRDSLVHELARLGTNLESTKTDYQTVKSLKPEEIAASRQDAEFVREAFKTSMKYPDNDGAKEKLKKRYDEYLAAFEKRLNAERQSYERFAEGVSATRSKWRAIENARASYQQAVAKYRAVENGAPGKQVGLVDLKLNDISLAAALEYIAQQAGVEMEVQPEAVVFGSREEIEALGGREVEPETEDPIAKKPTAVVENKTVNVGRGPDPADVYLHGYMAVREAEGLEKKGEQAAALKKFQESTKIFSTIAERWPQFEPEMVRFRLRKIEEQKDRIEAAVKD